MAVIKTHLLDASALVKLVIVEEGSETIREYFKAGSVFWTTSLCFAEALGVLKTKKEVIPLLALAKRVQRVP